MGTPNKSVFSGTGESPALRITHFTLRSPCAQRVRSERGVALLLVVSLLAVIGIMGVAFAFSMYLETQASQQFVATARSRYLAEAGIGHARALLDEDRLGTRVDDQTEGWARDFAGAEADLDNDRLADARWWTVTDSAGRVVGRYALRVVDEGGKATLHAARAAPVPTELGALNLTTLLSRAGISRAAAVAEAIEQYQYGGPGGRPGVDGVDDDRDGTIDEADEYQPVALRGDDRRLEGLEELATIGGLSREELERVARVATVYSWDLNVGVTGKRRLNVNTAMAEELLAVLLDVGVRDPWQVAVNMADYVDPDVEISRVTKSAQTIFVAPRGPLGSWVWRDEPVGHYRSENPGGAALSWIAPVPSGAFRVFLRGVEGMMVGDVTVAGQLRTSLADGAPLGVWQLDGSLAIEAANREPQGVACAIRGIELVAEASQDGVAIRGIEAIRVNELMVEPVIELAISEASVELQGSDWACPFGAAVCTNSGVGEARWSWTSAVVQPGRYHVRVFGSSAGQTVGLVRLGAESHLLVHGQRHPSTIVVGADGKISVGIGKTASDVTYYVGRFSLSLQPDGEYVELMNLSDRTIDLSGWTIEGELTGGRQARVPAGTLIQPHGLVVAVVDLDDGHPTLGGNGIDARSAWEIPSTAVAVQLEFPGGAPTPDDDWLKAELSAAGPARLLVRSGELVADEVGYPLPASARLQSLEKGDPSVVTDQDGDGVDDGWYPSLRLYTPGEPNDNDGMKAETAEGLVSHHPEREVAVLNRALQGIGELAGLPSGAAWIPFATVDLANLVDRLTVEGLRLEAEGHAVSGEEAWQERGAGYYEYSQTALPVIAGGWEWTDVPSGSYRFSLSGCPGCHGEQLSVRWQQADRSWTAWSPPRGADAQGRVVIGEITIGPESRDVPPSPGEEGPLEARGTPERTLALELTCASANGICHFDHAQLDPQLIRIGPINVNTAPLEVLLSLPEVNEAMASRIMAGRPYGDQERRGRGIGDLLLGAVLGEGEQEKLAAFQRLAHLLTTRSDVFQIVSLGQAIEGDHVEAAQRIVTVVERQDIR